MPLDVLDLSILALRIVLVVLLYGFVLLVLQGATRGLRAGSSSAAVLLPLRLEVVDPGGSKLVSGQVFEVGQSALLGRTEHVDVVIADATVSGEHARITRAGHAWLVSDLGSTNGTRLNDAAVNGDAPLSHGDVLALGNVQLRVRLTPSADLRDTERQRGDRCHARPV